MQHMKIDWKSDDKNLTKLYPREIDPDDESSIAEPGSFFNFFEQESDPMDVGDFSKIRKWKTKLIVWSDRGDDSNRSVPGCH